MSAWLLPDQIADVLPSEARQIEDLRRALLDTARVYGYELVIPPLIEHLDTLFSGAGRDLEDQTFTLTDPASGRLLGLRADMTPQAARIAARHFPDLPVVRLCYLGSVLRARPDSLGGSRAPRQVGCEIFGETALSADLGLSPEEHQLFLTLVFVAGMPPCYIDARDRPEGAFFPLRCDGIVYEGTAPRRRW